VVRNGEALLGRDTAARRPSRLPSTRSAPLLVQRGLAESLRTFRGDPGAHWVIPEMQALLDDVDQYIYFGGYPGSAELIADAPRWTRYILESLVERRCARCSPHDSCGQAGTLRRLFHLGCMYSGTDSLYQKMLGPTQEAGNTTTLAHYLELLAAAGMLTGFNQVQRGARRQRRRVEASSHEHGARQRQLSLSFARLGGRPTCGERLVESAVGAHLLNSSAGTPVEVYYWRERNGRWTSWFEAGKRLAAIEVKCGAAKGLPGNRCVRPAFRPQRTSLSAETVCAGAVLPDRPRRPDRRLIPRSVHDAGATAPAQTSERERSPAEAARGGARQSQPLGKRRCRHLGDHAWPT